MGSQNFEGQLAGEPLSTPVTTNSDNRLRSDDNQPESLEIEAKQNSVESWLRSQLGLEGSCKTIIEAHLVDKFHSRSVAEKKIRWDMAVFVLYMFFLIFYSIAACGTETKGKQMVRTLIEPAVGDFSSVKAIGLNISRDVMPASPVIDIALS
jgi:hypothetical protein